MRKTTAGIVFGGLLCAAAAIQSSGAAQSPSGQSMVVLDRADVLHKQISDSFAIVSGNVQFHKDGMVMLCDSAHFYPETESFDAFGNISMEQGDTLFIYADELHYDAPALIAELLADPGNVVRMINRDVTLETDRFIYDMGIEVGYYDTGGVLYDAQNRLVSLVGEYAPPTKDANFYRDVILTSQGRDDTLVIFSDSLFYNTLSHIAILRSPSEVINRRGTIYTTDGLYDTDLDTTALYQRSLVHTAEGRTLCADTIYYDRKTGISLALGNMVLTDSARQASMQAQYGYFHQPTDSAYACGDLLIKEYSGEDTLYLHGGQLNAYRVIEIPSSPETPETPETPASPSSPDTTQIIDIWPRVRLFRSDLQGICDSMRVTTKDSTLRMHRHPVLWNENNQISGKIVEILFNDSTIHQMRLPEFGFVCSRVDADYYNQLSGKSMIADLRDGSLSRLQIDGNVEIIMYPEEADSTTNKQVTAESSFLTATFKDGLTEYLKMWPQTTGKATPLFLLRKSQLFLPKFRLYKGIRPISPASVMIVPKEMDDLMAE